MKEFAEVVASIVLGRKQMLYRAYFLGRKLHAIGILYEIWTTVEANNKEEATLKLYLNYEHIQHLSLEEVLEV